MYLLFAYFFFLALKEFSKWNADWASHILIQLNRIKWVPRADEDQVAFSFQGDLFGIRCLPCKHPQYQEHA